MATAADPAAEGDGGLRPAEFRNRQGMRLAADVAGPEAGPVVLFLHGAGQTRRGWANAVETLGGLGFRAVSLDMRGHGDSDWAPDGDYRVEAFAGDVIDVLSAIGDDGPPAVVGASLGGLSAWLAIGRADEPPARAIALVDIVPGFRGSGVDAIRGFMSANPDGFASIEAAADAVAAYLPHRKRPTDTSGLARNLRQRENGRWYWHWDPQLMGGALGLNVPQYREEMVAIARRMPLPVLLVRGSRSRVVTDEGVAHFRELVPHVRYVNVAGADHMVAGDANDAFNRPLIAFLQESAGPAG